MNTRYLIANWKMNVPPEGIDRYIAALAAVPPDAVTVVVAPPFPFLKEVASIAGELPALSAQNCADHERGAYTGEVSPQMIRECGAQYVIIGHSERRHIYGESDALVARKLAAAAGSGLTPILCIGEDLRTRDAGMVARFLADQLRAASAGLEGAGEIVIAYEPVWAIGTGRNATGSMVAGTVADIRGALQRFWPERYHTGASILYGGSVTPDNISDLEANGRIDGYLVGGASLDSKKLLAIRERMRENGAA